VLALVDWSKCIWLMAWFYVFLMDIDTRKWVKENHQVSFTWPSLIKYLLRDLPSFVWLDQLFVHNSFFFPFGYTLSLSLSHTHTKKEEANTHMAGSISILTSKSKFISW
jgi:hypothetical protein